MASKSVQSKNSPPRDGGNESIAQKVISVPVEQELQDGFLAYSLSVIHSRAIPDVRDGLKPVQRRILYAMYKERLRSNSPYRKSARVVGTVMGTFHPHGDSAIYEALVRLGQDFSMKVPLVDPHGNFGSLDDGPAASRYTECRLSSAAEVLLSDIDEDTVDFRPNYDGEENEPVYLPAGFPNLLVNGTSGIAVGMATSIPPHNLIEVSRAVQVLLKNPEATLKQVMRVLPAPDFPSGGEIVSGENLLEAYTNGKGSIRLRAKMELVHSGQKHSIMVTELPYQVGPERVIAKIADLVKSDRISGIADIQDLSDRSGIKIMIDLASGANPQNMVAQLCKLTPLEETVSINAIALADGQPKTLPLLEMLNRFIEHRLDVVVRRTRFRLAKAEARAHLIEGLVIALGNIDEVVRIIKTAKDTHTAKVNLCKKLKLTEIQAEHILEMQLRRLTRLEAVKLKEELAELKSSIKEFKSILASPEKQNGLVSEELAAVTKQYGVERKTEVLDSDPLEGQDIVFEVADNPTEITLSDTGLVGRTPEDGWKGRQSADDLLLARIDCRTTSNIFAVSPDGLTGKFVAVDTPEIGKDRGTRLGPMIGLPHGSMAGIFLAPKEVEDNDSTIVLITENGVIKRLTFHEIENIRNGSPIIRLAAGDRVISAFSVTSNDDVGIVTSDGQLLRTAVKNVRPQGRAAGGVAGIKLRDGAKVVAGWSINDDDIVVVSSSSGKAKATKAKDFPSKGRGTGGVRCMNLAKDATITAAWCGAQQNLLARTTKGIKRIKPSDGRRDGAGTDEGSVWTAIGVAR